jgi:Protein of unknown function (DUF2933)
MNSDTQRSSRSATAIIAGIAFFAIVGFFLLGEHRVHALGLLPWLLLLALLACPFMHMFMHGGHGGHGGHESDGRQDDASSRWNGGSQ